VHLLLMLLLITMLHADAEGNAAADAAGTA
jgi:hypothetical protein